MTEAALGKAQWRAQSKRHTLTASVATQAIFLAGGLSRGIMAGGGWALWATNRQRREYEFVGDVGLAICDQRHK